MRAATPHCDRHILLSLEGSGNVFNAFWRCATHPDLLTLEHVDLVQALVAVLHSEYQQRVVGAAVQHRLGLRDPAQGERLQLGLQSSQ